MTDWTPPEARPRPKGKGRGKKQSAESGKPSDLSGPVIATVAKPVPEKLKKPSLIQRIFMASASYNWDNFFEMIRYVAGFLVAGIVSFFLLTTMKSCQSQSEMDDQTKLKIKNDAMEDCIGKTQKIFECREIYK